MLQSFPRTDRILRKSNCKRLGLATAAISFAAASCALCLPISAQTAGAYKVTNLISDGSVPAAVTDPNFINPWAISDSPTWWISTANTGYNYVVASTPTLGTINFKVIVPAATGTNTSPGFPAGSVTTAGAVGMILSNATKASFLFSTLDGTISGWNSKLGTANAISQVVVNKNSAGASYPGLAIVNTGTASYILTANFGTGNAIEVYDSSFQPTKLAGTFTDPNLPTGYSPFSVHVLNNKVYVAYALRSSTTPYRTIDAPGNGAVSAFDTSGNFIARVATGGNLDSPWGVAFAPANFGIFGGSLLIGNFGDGLINAYDPVTFAYKGQLTDGSGKPLSYASLWELLPGGTTVGNATTVSGGDPNTVYITAGLTGEVHGLFAAISNDSSNTGTPTFGFSAGTTSITVAGGNSASIPISIAPVNGFSGSVNLSCSGVPVGTTCSFSSAQVSATPAAPAISTLTIATSRTSAGLDKFKGGGAALAYAFLFPFSVLMFRGKRSRLFGAGRLLLLVCGILIGGLGAVVGCTTASSTPAGTSQVVVTAKSGAITQTANIALTVQ